MEYIKQSGTERANKSQQKREFAALKVHAEFLCGLKPKAQQELTLNEEIRNGLAEFNQIKHPNAQKRHVQFMTRLLSEFNELETLLEQLHQLQNPHLKQQQLEKQLENLTNKLLNTEQESLHQESIEKLFSEHPDIDKQQFMQILRNAQKEIIQNKKNDQEEQESKQQKPEGKQLKKLKSLLRELLSKN